MPYDIVYLGNKLQKKGLSPTTIDTLSPQLSEIFSVKTSSSHKNLVLRLAAMWYRVFRSRNTAHAVLIDTYSSAAFNYAWTCATLCRWFGIPYIAFLHGGDLPQNRLEKTGRIEKNFFGKAAKLVAPSGYLKAAFEKHGYAVTVVPNNIPLKNYPFVHRQQLRPKLLYVRAFQQLYNPLMALDVLQNLLPQYPEAELCMVGGDKDGTQAVFEQEVKSRGLESRVKITGRLPKEEWIALSSEYDIFLNTTNVDNTPVSVMEAMALGMCVVTTNVGGIPYLFEDGVEGVMVSPQDPNAMTEAVLDLLQNPEKASRISKAARAKAQQWDWEEVKKAWMKVFGEVVG